MQTVASAPPFMQNNSISGSTLVILLGLLFSCLGYETIRPETVFSMQLNNTQASAKITFNAEYDDNVNLSSGLEGDDELKSDLLFHTVPAIELTHTYIDHKFHFGLSGDYRKGTGSSISETNINTSTDIDLNFPGGFSVNLLNTYTETAFDQNLDEETEPSDRQADRYQIHAIYKFGLRLKAEGEYGHLWQEFDDELESTVYDSDTVNGKLTVPVSIAWESYLSGFLETFESEQAVKRNCDIQQYLFGFQRRSRSELLFIWLEAGYEHIDYTSDEWNDSAEIIGETGTKIIFSPRSSISLSLGRNGYGKIKYAALFKHHYSDKLDIRLSADKRTRKSFSTVIDEQFYDTARLKLSLSTAFMERFRISLEGSYQLLQYTEPVTTWTGRTALDYPIQFLYHFY
ncbi:MAG: hypothetical protein D3903_01990 [Candidatus Electrothrix sp. GM3_4]|nr:hypothetical protein [Candidatus Electrothrix sp. GM3_4]